MSQKYTHGVRYKKRPKWRLLVISLVVLAISGLTALGYKPHSQAEPIRAPAMTVQTPPVAPAAVNYGLPVRLAVPKLQVNAPITYMGLTKGGQMNVPGNVIDAGWYKYGALPGNVGTAVIAGHLDGLRGEAGVFSRLEKLAAGDSIIVTDSNNKAVVFVVREMKSYGQDEQPSEVFNSTSGAHLNLITCAGSWDKTEKKFAKRLVVFADKAS